jgi:hypothetical protein
VSEIRIKVLLLQLKDFHLQRAVQALTEQAGLFPR